MSVLILKKERERSRNNLLRTDIISDTIISFKICFIDLMGGNKEWNLNLEKDKPSQAEIGICSFA